MWLFVIWLKTAPRLPQMPVCSQLKMVLLRTMCEPIFSRDQPARERPHDDFVVVRGAVLARVVDPDVVAGLCGPCPG